MSQTTTSRTLILAALCAALFLVPLVAAPADAVEDVTPARVEGDNRFATAAAIAAQAFPQGTEQAVVTTAAAAQDALTASSFAGATGAAILLVELDRVPDETATALSDLGVRNVTIVGGELGVSEAVQDELAETYEVQRIAGEDQYDTAELVSIETVERVGLPEVDGLRTVMLANGEKFPDALAGSPAGFAGPVPVLYAELDDLRDEVRAFLGSQDVEQVVILGGEFAISEGVEAEITGSGRNVIRLGGQDRTQTAEEVAAWTTETFDVFAEDAMMIARGDDYPDALTAGQLAGRFGRPLLLSATPSIVSEGTVAYFADRCEVIEVVQAVGGELAVSTPVLERVEQAAETCTAGGDPGGPLGDDALPDFTMTAEQTDDQPLTFVNDNPYRPRYATSVVDTVAATDLGGATSLDAVLFDCDAITVDGDGSAVFTDADDDGFADGYGETVNGTSLVVGINNVAVEQDTSATAQAPKGDRFGVQVSAYEADCATLVVVPAQDEGVPVDENGRATVDYGVSEIRFGDHPADEPDGPDDPDDPDDPDGPAATQVYRVDPQQAIEGAAGEPQMLTVNGRFDDQPISDALDIILFPCGNTDVLGSGPDTFTDADGDGGADGFAASDTGAMLITTINGEPIDARTAVGSVRAVDDQIEITVESQAADCATVVAVSGDGNGQFDVDADGVPVEDYGVGQVNVS